MDSIERNRGTNRILNEKKRKERKKSSTSFTRSDPLH